LTNPSERINIYLVNRIKVITINNELQEISIDFTDIKTADYNFDESPYQMSLFIEDILNTHE